MGGQTDSQLDVSSTQVPKKAFQCSLARAPVQNNTEANTLGEQTAKNLRSLACKFEPSHRNLPNKQASQLAITCDSLSPVLSPARKLTHGL